MRCTAPSVRKSRLCAVRRCAMFSSRNVASEKLLNSWSHVLHHGHHAHHFCLQFFLDTLYRDAVKEHRHDFLENYFLLPCSFTHNWWHVAVCYLEGESPTSKVLEVYDQIIMKELDRSDSEAAEVYVNALGLLLRLYVRGEIGPAKERLTLLDELKNESIWHVEWLLDFLILWALSSMNEIKAAENLLDSLRSRVSSMDAKRQQVMHKAIQLADAVSKYGKGEHKAVFDILGPDFDGLSYKMIGASDEQVDVFNEVWYTVLINVGETSTAIEVLDKQISKREGAPFLWRLLEKAYSVEGRGVDASVASEKANALQAAYFP